jgi:hypothetical protein
MRRIYINIASLLLITTLLGAVGCSIFDEEYYGTTGDTDKLEIVNHYLLATVNGKAVVRFAVKNISERRIWADVEISYYDENEEIIGSDNITVSDIAPGEKSDLIRVASSLSRSEVKGYGIELRVKS